MLGLRPHVMTTRWKMVELSPYPSHRLTSFEISKQNILYERLPSLL